MSHSFVLPLRLYLGHVYRTRSSLPSGVGAAVAPPAPLSATTHAPIAGYFSTLSTTDREPTWAWLFLGATSMWLVWQGKGAVNVHNRRWIKGVKGHMPNLLNIMHVNLAFLSWLCTFLCVTHFCCDMFPCDPSFRHYNYIDPPVAVINSSFGNLYQCWCIFHFSVFNWNSLVPHCRWIWQQPVLQQCTKVRPFDPGMEGGWPHELSAMLRERRRPRRLYLRDGGLWRPHETTIGWKVSLMVI